MVAVRRCIEVLLGSPALGIAVAVWGATRSPIWGHLALAMPWQCGVSLWSPIWGHPALGIAVVVCSVTKVPDAAVCGVTKVPSVRTSCSGDAVAARGVTKVPSAAARGVTKVPSVRASCSGDAVAACGVTKVPEAGDSRMLWGRWGSVGCHCCPRGVVQCREVPGTSSPRAVDGRAPEPRSAPVPRADVPADQELPHQLTKLTNTR